MFLHFIVVCNCEMIFFVPNIPMRKGNRLSQQLLAQGKLSRPVENQSELGDWGDVQSVTKLT